MVELEFEFKQFISIVGVCIHYAITQTHSCTHAQTQTDTHTYFSIETCVMKYRIHPALSLEEYLLSIQIQQIWELDSREGKAPKNWHFQTVLLEKTPENPLDFRESKPINLKWNQPWILLGRTDTEAEALIRWPPDRNSWLIRKDPDAGKDWGQEEKGVTEDEMVGWHHWFIEYDLEQTLGDGEGQRGLVCCSQWVAKSQTWLGNWKYLNSNFFSYFFLISYFTFLALYSNTCFLLVLLLTTLNSLGDPAVMPTHLCRVTTSFSRMSPCPLCPKPQWLQSCPEL